MNALKKRKKISIVTPCFNEQDNLLELYKRLKSSTLQCPNYEYEYIFIDNASTDDSIDLLRKLALKDKSLKVIINTRNFGHIRSPYWGILQSSGDATIYLASDLQDPPELIPQFIKAWESGYKVALGVKPQSDVSFIFHKLRKFYYKVLNYISDTPLIENATGFGLYDKEIIDYIKKIADPYPYFRGIVAELGYEVLTIPFKQIRRLNGITKNNFYTLYDIAMLGIISHSLFPIRVASILGFIIGFLCIFISFVFLVLKLFYWDSFPLGVAPVVISIFFMFGILLIFIGLIGEYVGSIHTYLKKRPVVVEKERINF